MKNETYTRSVRFGVSAHNLLKYGTTYCPECGSEVVGDWVRLWRTCNCNIDTLITSEGKTIPIGSVRRVRLNTTAQKMINSKIDWDGIDIMELHEEWGSFEGIADYLGVSARSVKRRYDAVVSETYDQPINNFL